MENLESPEVYYDTLEVVEIPGKGKGVISKRDFREGEIICALDFSCFAPKKGALIDAVQVWEDLFVDFRGDSVSDFFNHGCDPNVIVRLNRYYDFLAIRDIRKGDEITFNYLTTEWDLVCEGLDFDCKCGSENCYGRIRGFKYLSREQQEKLRPRLTPFLRFKMGSKLEEVLVL